ncbi:hypothetical protein KXD96_28115 (plasmid) [Mycobacterium sp. SMC-2]|uniref:hypothetical protein n=1 Tax=Mycobacterium sp. SMC-2 TaxID=2857058 RepID=UPI0021B2DF23|nr:hypothetical protein [Mycobacterium sp. SMC-2]UXA06601.1 hypothetical protein KXD96_00010 [Mycobacterium sp. SMC-2]UXA09628.1 hypothetical protein KXD96_28115 [Mycobacterium sp. SMC-2]
MGQQKINASTQVQAGTVTATEVDSSVIVAAGTNAFTGAQSMGGHQLTSVANGVASSDAVNLGQVQGMLAGFSMKATAQACCTGAETFTIASGSVTTINGTTIDGVTVAVGDTILIPTAPAASGTGTAVASGLGTNEAANGLYTVTAIATNISVSRAADLSGTISPAGAFVLVEAGTDYKGTAFWVSTPSSPDTGFTYGTTTMQWQEFPLGSGVTSLSVTNTNGFNASIANPTTSPAISIETTVTGIMKGNGTAASAAVAGTDYLAPSSLANRETPTGSLNGSNTAFTTANTPISGSEMLFLNGILLQAGSGNDYTITGNAITMALAPAATDRLEITYWF